jgi:hypothetical protein
MKYFRQNFQILKYIVFNVKKIKEVIFDFPPIFLKNLNHL